MPTGPSRPAGTPTAIYDFELDAMFTRSWVIAGSLDRLAKSATTSSAAPGTCRSSSPAPATASCTASSTSAATAPTPSPPRTAAGKLLQCAYHAWTYELDGRLNRAPRAEAEPGFDKADFSLVPVSVDTWGPLVWVNPDPDAPPLREAYPGFEELAAAHGMDFSGYAYHSRSSYSIPANWKVWVENASECYHCPTIHGTSFADAWDVDHGTYEYVNQDRLLGQFTVPNAKAREFRKATGEFRYIFVWPSSFIVMDEYVAFPGIITPTGPQTCDSHSHFYAREGLDPAFVAEWVGMYDRTLHRGRRGSAPAAARPALEDGARGAADAGLRERHRTVPPDGLGELQGVARHRGLAGARRQYAGAVATVSHLRASPVKGLNQTERDRADAGRRAASPRTGGS